MNTVSIRPMHSDDKSAVMKILQSTPEFLSHEVIIAEELIDDFLKDRQKSGYHILVSETDRQINGYICYGETPLTKGTWDIYWMAVARRQQGRGVGGVLIKEAENEIRSLQGRLAIIETSSKQGYNKTRKFYVTQGYTEVARIPDFYTVGDDKVIMTKRLS